MRLVHTPDELDIPACVLVPTMGALHDGHASLIAMAVADAAARGVASAVSVFVNPTQFNNPRDLEIYPRTLDRDAARCEQLGVDVVFAPSVEAVYPDGLDTPLGFAIPEVASQPGLEDRGRPGHFEGVCRVVARLFELTRCGAAVFGEKDWQQLQCARAMGPTRALGVEILAHPIVREADGLAMSSRNVHLSPEARIRALSLSQAVRAAGDAPTPAHAEDVMREVLRDGGVDRVDYAVVRDAETLLLPTPETRSWRALVTAEVGGVRLLDNGPWSPTRGGAGGGGLGA